MTYYSVLQNDCPAHDIFSSLYFLYFVFSQLIIYFLIIGKNNDPNSFLARIKKTNSSKVHRKLPIIIIKHSLAKAGKGSWREHLDISVTLRLIIFDRMKKRSSWMARVGRLTQWADLVIQILTVQFSCVAWCPRMSADILGTSWDQCRIMVQYSFTSTETRRLVRTDSPGLPPRLSHSSWTMSKFWPADAWF